MTKIYLLSQLLFTALILAFVQNNLLITILFIIGWSPLFLRRPARELIIFILINLIFVANDITAIQNNFFQFTNPNISGLPYWEFIMWGYYLIHTHRFLNRSYPIYFEWKALALAILFSALFGIVADRILLLMASSAVLGIAFIFYHEKDDFLYCGYMMSLGIIFEFIGVHQKLWMYPEQNYQSALIQFVVMWGFVGLFFRRLVGPWLTGHNKVQLTAPHPDSYLKDVWGD